MKIGVAANVYQTFLTIKDSQTVCTTTTNAHPSPGFVFVGTIEGALTLPDWYFSA